MFWWIFNASDSAEQRSTGSSFAQSKLAATVRNENKPNHYKLQNTKVLNSKKN